MADGCWDDFVAVLNDQDDDDSALHYSDLEHAGPPVGALDFPTPTFFYSEITSVKAVDHRTGKSRTIESVLTRLRNRNNGGGGGGNDHPAKAYLIRKKIAKTTYGSIRVAVVLHRRPDHEAKVDNVPWISSEELVAIKISSWNKIRQMRGKHLEDPVKEVGALQLVGNYHPHVMGCHEVLQDDKHLYIVMPYYASGSNLHNRLFSDPAANPTKHRYRPSEKEAQLIFRQLLRGLFYLQRKGIFHRDIALENILISKSDKIKIIDLGMSLRVPYSDPCNEGCITDVSEGETRRLMKPQGKGGRLMYLAPELLAENEPFDGFAADLWAAGVTLFVLCVGLAPFKFAEHSEKRFAKISSGGLKSLMKTLKISLSPEACDLLQSMLWEDPRDRLSLAEVMNHPWVMGKKMEIKDTKAKKESRLETVLETGISSHASVGSLSTTEPTLELLEMKLDDGSPPSKSETPLSNPPDMIAVHPESRESASETRETDQSSTEGVSPQPTYRFPKIGGPNAKRLMSNAQQQIGPKFMSKFEKFGPKIAIASVNKARSSSSNNNNNNAVEHSKSPIRAVFQTKQHKTT